MRISLNTQLDITDNQLLNPEQGDPRLLHINDLMIAHTDNLLARANVLRDAESWAEFSLVMATLRIHNPIAAENIQLDNNQMQQYIKFMRREGIGTIGKNPIILFFALAYPNIANHALTESPAYHKLQRSSDIGSVGEHAENMWRFGIALKVIDPEKVAAQITDLAWRNTYRSMQNMPIDWIDYLLERLAFVRILWPERFEQIKNEIDYDTIIENVLSIPKRADMLNHFYAQSIWLRIILAGNVNLTDSGLNIGTSIESSHVSDQLPALLY